ncbi:uncharacterized protein LOC106670724 [Cimex lectularius]|uniref:Uncharacterized protein n=1 Tax=Cimex lectularius TaxID=79782 RepID=A0A8I6SBH7_CIMLE|nr:uncharacterized protein LOC106670724 [Cimex lectularius]
MTVALTFLLLSLYMLHLDGLSSDQSSESDRPKPHKVGFDPSAQLVLQLLSPFVEFEFSSEESSSIELEDLVLTIGFESSNKTSTTTTTTTIKPKTTTKKKPNRG